MYSVRCLNGYKKKMDELGLFFFFENVFEIDEFDVLKVIIEVVIFLKKYSNIIVVVCLFDYLVIGVIKVVNMFGLFVFKDLFVVGVDDVLILDFIIFVLFIVYVDLLGIG